MLLIVIVDVFVFQSLGAPGGGKGGAMMRSPSAIKTMLLEWCKAMTREYIDVCKSSHVTYMEWQSHDPSPA